MIETDYNKDMIKISYDAMMDFFEASMELIEYADMLHYDAAINYNPILYKVPMIMAAVSKAQVYDFFDAVSDGLPVSLSVKMSRGVRDRKVAAASYDEKIKMNENLKKAEVAKPNRSRSWHLSLG